MHDTEAPTTQAERDAAQWRDTAGRYLSALVEAERQRDEVGIQLAAAQAEIARMRRVVDEARTLMATPACERLPAERAVCVALRALDTVPGDAMVRS